MSRYFAASTLIVIIWITFAVMAGIFSGEAALFANRMSVMVAWFIVGGIIASALTVLITYGLYVNAPSARKADDRRQLTRLLNNMNEDDLAELQDLLSGEKRKVR